MNGMINKGLKAMLTHRYGAPTWADIFERSGLDDDLFISLEAYEDSTSFALIEAASAVLAVSGEEIWRQMGAHWTTFAIEQGFGQLMQASGQDVFAFLTRLNVVHERVTTGYPEARPPVFEIRHLNPDEIELHYHSSRQGLGGMVKGLAQGLGDYFEQPLDVEQVAHRDRGDAHDVFRVRRGR